MPDCSHVLVPAGCFVSLWPLLGQAQAAVAAAAAVVVFGCLPADDGS